MAEHKPCFEWDTEYFERRHGRFGKLQLALIGLAIGLLMMDLAKPYTLIPLAALFLWLSSTQKKLETLLAEFDEATLTLSPRSLLIKQPLLDDEERIEFRNLALVGVTHKGGMATLRLTLKDDRQLELPGFVDADECHRLLQQAIDTQV